MNDSTKKPEDQTVEEWLRDYDEAEVYVDESDAQKKKRLSEMEVS